jgi:hypothetical protein
LLDKNNAQEEEAVMADKYIEELKVKVRDREEMVRMKEEQLRVKEEELTALKRRVD